jgi:aldose 1-epimerase
MELGREPQIPTGELRSVEDTPFDLRKEEVLGDRVPQVDGGGKPGYDHCFMVNDYEPLTGGESDAEVHAKLRLMATLRDPASGRAMDVYGTQPGIQVRIPPCSNAHQCDAPASPRR